ncbi:MAG: DUF2807 domain-containing protein, partial [Anaerolineae bacterium]|nr:DUF2807 domain-containing protein [Anaerolineae bacterium]
MKKQLSIVLFTVVLAVALQGCMGVIVRGSGRVVEQERDVSGFDQVALSGQGTLHIEVGRKTALRIEAEDNLMPYLETRVQGDRLTIGVRNGTILSTMRPIHYYLTVKDLDTLVLSGSGKIVAPDLQSDAFTVTVSGSGQVEMDDLEADDVHIR